MPTAPRYVPRRPHEPALHRLVREHLATFLEHARTTYAAPLPRYVVEAFERYRACGDFSRGFVRCRCDACRHDVLVAFSCKARGVCPSCAGRRMCNEAAHITDRILPSVPVRQWVLSVPFDLRALGAMKPDVRTAVSRIFAEEIARAKKRLANVDGAETGVLSFHQNFGGSLNAHAHWHDVAVDGVFEKVGEGVRFHEAPVPDKANVEDVARRVHDRVVRWLRRHGHLDERAAEERSNEPAALSPMEDMTGIALARGTFLARPFARKGKDHDEPFADKPSRFAASYDGFDVHCGVRIAASDDEGRERLLRYCARPPFATDRVEVLKDGRVAYLLKTARRGSTHRVMTPIEFLTRMAALVPPPFFPTITYHGVFAARSTWRPLVTPKPPASASRLTKRACDDGHAPKDEPAKPPKETTNEPRPTSPASPLSDAEMPTSITVDHWRRLLDGELFAVSRRIDWNVLLRRTFGVDSLACPKCEGRMAVLATLTDRNAVTKILTYLGLPTSPPPRAAARDPTDDQTSFNFDAA